MIEHASQAFYPARLSEAFHIFIDKILLPEQDTDDRAYHFPRR